MNNQYFWPVSNRWFLFDIRPIGKYPKYCHNLTFGINPNGLAKSHN